MTTIAGHMGMYMRLSENVTGQELIHATRSIIEKSDLLKRFYFGFVDHTHAKSVHYESHEIQHVVELDMEMAKFTCPGMLMAIVAPSDLQFGMSRMWQTLADKTGWESQIFRQTEEAEAWLLARTQEKFGHMLNGFLEEIKNIP